MKILLWACTLMLTSCATTPATYNYEKSKSLVAGILALIFANRSWSRSIISTLRSRNAALWWVVGNAIGFLVAVLYVPYLREAFHFAALRPYDLVICMGAGALSVVWFEIVKFARNWRKGELVGTNNYYSSVLVRSGESWTSSCYP